MLWIDKVNLIPKDTHKMWITILFFKWHYRVKLGVYERIFAGIVNVQNLIPWEVLHFLWRICACYPLAQSKLETNASYNLSWLLFDPKSFMSDSD